MPWSRRVVMRESAQRNPTRHREKICETIDPATAWSFWFWPFRSRRSQARPEPAIPAILCNHSQMQAFGTLKGAVFQEPQDTETAMLRNESEGACRLFCPDRRKRLQFKVYRQMADDLLMRWEYKRGQHGPWLSHSPARAGSFELKTPCYIQFLGGRRDMAVSSAATSSTRARFRTQ